MPTFGRDINVWYSDCYDFPVFDRIKFGWWWVPSTDLCHLFREYGLSASNTTPRRRLIVILQMLLDICTYISLSGILNVGESQQATIQTNCDGSSIVHCTCNSLAYVKIGYCGPIFGRALYRTLLVTVRISSHFLAILLTITIHETETKTAFANYPQHSTTSHVFWSFISCSCSCFWSFINITPSAISV